MKGITHFTFGIAIGTLFPSVLKNAIFSGGLDVIWGGIGGYLPDFIDFKITRFLEKWDYEFEPDDKEKNPEKIIDFLEKSIEKAYKDKKEIKIKLHTLQTGPDEWIRYGIIFDNKNKKIKAFYAPKVNLSQIPVENVELKESERKIEIPFKYEYEKEILVDIFSGPSLSLKREKDFVKIIFIPWHRKWSHSIFSALLFSLITGIFLYLIKSPFYFINSIIFFLGYLSHIFLDQLGFMGSNIFWPFQKERIKGFKITESIDPVYNFSFILFSISLIIFNILRVTPHTYKINPYLFLLIFGIILPLTIISFSKILKFHRELEEEKDEIDDSFMEF